MFVCSVSRIFIVTVVGLLVAIAQMKLYVEVAGGTGVIVSLIYICAHNRFTSILSYSLFEVYCVFCFYTVFWVMVYVQISIIYFRYQQQCKIHFRLPLITFMYFLFFGGYAISQNFYFIFD